ncbi:Uncharacterized conserved protein YlxW, UPF0749 family [Evansella caseinilytica]|uniref:Uncharacterized conserved protein YlxW, UPF0749 family n=1 Tax=Evansella caseinilytica TaxID=1503961 RepID=A0A1H3MIA3_9BACI|nr:DUF881 domain-containing protein [Evansella caseinilytica]SDY75899.1 Uncharacterized conserved protein YlxW, UPF0749 family [Evansella caseinilytica]
MRVKGSHVIFSFVLLVTGFILAVSYQFAKENVLSTANQTNTQWKEEDDLRNQVLMEQTINRNLTQELRVIQSQITEIEEEIANRQRKYYNLVEDIDRLRMVTGSVQVKGEGISVTLRDAEYVQEGENPNNYIVHEQHLQMVIDELYVTGAEAIAVNGHRLNHQSYIQCIGPVIEIDGHVSFAPFEITAIGDSETLIGALNMVGGVTDFLLNDNIEVRIEKESEIILDPYFSEGG